MHVPFDPSTDLEWDLFFQQQIGNGIVAYRGFPVQRGGGMGSIFKGIFRFLMPVLKKTGKAIGSELLSAGAQMATDIMNGSSIKDSVQRQGMRAMNSLLQRGVDATEGHGRRKRKRTITSLTFPPGKRSPKRSNKRSKLEDALGVIRNV